MGMTIFRDVQDTIVLAWQDEDRDGLEIAVTVSSMAAFIAAERWHRRILDGRPIRGKHLAELAAVFVDHVERWNVTTAGGRPVRVTLAGFLGLHRDRVVTPVLRQWVAFVLNPPSQPVAAEAVAEQPVEPAVPDIADLLVSQSLTRPRDDEQLVEPDPELEPEPALAAVGT